MSRCNGDCLGVFVLYAMWMFHLLLFRGAGIASWIGLLVVLQNFVSSLLNSHLFDFHEGWMYVIGVGVAGGVMLGRVHEQDGQRCRTVIRRTDKTLRELAKIMRFYGLTWRNWTIAAHDALATAVAVLASFYLRFEGSSFFDRLPLLLRILPYFVLLSLVVCYFFQLTTTKWRFISLPDLLNIAKAATVLAIGLLVLDYIFLAPNVYGTFFLGKTTIILYWFLEVFFLSGARLAYRYFRYTRVRRHARTEGAAPTLVIGRAADAEILLRGIESGAVTRVWPVGVLSPSAADRGQSIRSTPVLGGVDDLEEVVRDFCQAR